MVIFPGGKDNASLREYKISQLLFCRKRCIAFILFDNFNNGQENKMGISVAYRY